MEDFEKALARIEFKLDAIQMKQAEFDAHAKLVVGFGKFILGISTTIFGLMHWDRVIQLVHDLTAPKP